MPKTLTRIQPSSAFATTPFSLPLSTHRFPTVAKNPAFSHRFQMTMAIKRFPARTAVITGASGGIGAETARGLVRDLDTLDHLFLCCRDVAKGESIAAPLRASSSGLDVTIVPVELTSPTSIASCADTLSEKLQGAPLDLLICNAGIMAPPLGFADEFGEIEQQFAINHLSHALLSKRLLPSLRAGEGGRIVFVSSLAASFAKSRETPPVSTERTRNELNEGNYGKWKMYADSKLAMSMYARALAKKEEKVESVSLHPGIVQTELGRYLLPSSMANWASASAGKDPSMFQRFLSLFGFKTPAQGAELSLELACADRGELQDGEFYIAKGGRLISNTMAPLLRNIRECEKVYADTENVLDKVGPTVPTR